MRHTRLIAGCLAIAAAGLVISLSAGSAAAQDTVKIGIVIPMTGTSGAVGREISDAAHLYMAQHGDTVAGKKIELIVKDDASVPDNAKRLAQELIVNDKVSFLGAGLTPSAMAMAPIATEGKVPTVVMVSGTSVVTEKSPYYVRTSFTLGQQSGIIADWAIAERQQESGHDPVRLGAGRRSRQGLCRLTSPRAAAKFSIRSKCRSPIRTSRRSCSAPTICSPTRCSSSSRPVRPEPSPSNSPSAAWKNRASSSSDRATSPTTTICRPPATRSSASSPRGFIRRRIPRSSTRTMSRPTKRPPAIAPISSRSAAMTACI